MSRPTLIAAQDDFDRCQRALPKGFAIRLTFLSPWDARVEVGAVVRGDFDVWMAESGHLAPGLRRMTTRLLASRSSSENHP